MVLGESMRPQKIVQMIRMHLLRYLLEARIRPDRRGNLYSPLGMNNAGPTMFGKIIQRPESI